MNETWQRGGASGQVSLAIHRLAKVCGGKTVQTALRLAGHTIGTGHTRDHAMIASDYPAQTINLLHPGDLAAATAEHGW